VTTSFKYQPPLDGLRAVAVGGVIVYHFGSDLPGGFLGVDTFFVLSGYLITSLLLAEWGKSGTIHFSAFWARRARRLLPALLLALVAIVCWASFAADADRLSSIRADSLWTLGYGANWHFINSGQSYFELFLEASPLRHAWSLAIEEQFYLVWPLITFACLRLGRGRTHVLAAVCVGGAVASAVLMAAIYSPVEPSRAYFGTDTRASQLLVGASLAILLARWAPKSNVARTSIRAIGAVGAVATVLAFAVVSDRDAWMYRGGFLAFAIATACVIASAVQPGSTVLRAVLSVRPARWVGQISYGLYLWHWPVSIWLSPDRTGIDGWSLALVRLAVTFGASTLSYYVIELPIRRGQIVRTGRFSPAFAPSAMAACAVVILVTTTLAT
jgi:peptidoglycan/LPS O-acetylase OafA/YrhL